MRAILNEDEPSAIGDTIGRLLTMEVRIAGVGRTVQQRLDEEASSHAQFIAKDDGRPGAANVVKRKVCDPSADVASLTAIRRA